MSSAPHATEMPDRPILIIDSSSAQGAVALYDGHALSTRSWAAERSHTTTLLAEIHHLLDAAQRDVAGLGAIAISLGPGTFTGLRAGFGIAKGFHLATGVPLMGISTLEATALPFAVSGLPIAASVAAGRGRLVWSHFAPDSDSVRETGPPRNGTVDELISEIADLEAIVIAGEIDAEQAARLTTVSSARIPPPALRGRSPAAWAELAWRRWRASSFDDPASLEPVYRPR